jgi:hypothetical protein
MAGLVEEGPEVRKRGRRNGRCDSGSRFDWSGAQRVEPYEMAANTTATSRSSSGKVPSWLFSLRTWPYNADQLLNQNSLVIEKSPGGHTRCAICR